MSQARKIPQIKVTIEVYEKLIRDFTIQELLAKETINQQEAQALTTARVLVHITEDGRYRSITLDPVWPEA